MRGPRPDAFDRALASMAPEEIAALPGDGDVARTHVHVLPSHGRHAMLVCGAPIDTDHDGTGARHTESWRKRIDAALTASPVILAADGSILTATQDVVMNETPPEPLLGGPG